jgi:hypothetical protein
MLILKNRVLNIPHPSLPGKSIHEALNNPTCATGDVQHYLIHWYIHCIEGREDQRLISAKILLYTSWNRESNAKTLSSYKEKSDLFQPKYCFTQSETENQMPKLSLLYKEKRRSMFIISIKLFMWVRFKASETPNNIGASPM